MKIDFNNYDFSQFIVKEGLFCNKAAKLIIPSDLGCEFTQKNKIFRSSVWDLAGNLLSASFPKFCNWLERPEAFPVPKTLDNTDCRLKIDGSTYIVDCIDDLVSRRSRGTFSYSTLENAAEWDYVWKKYPLIEQFIRDFKHISLLFEIVSPSQRIVINYGPEADLYLTGLIFKENYELGPQKLLDEIARDLNVNRPLQYEYPSFEKMLEIISKDEENEGICVYSPDENGMPDQNIHKCKTAKYCLLHKMKSSLASFNNIVDLYLAQNKPSYDEFYLYVKNTFDYEIAEMCKENLEKCCMLGEWSKNVLADIKKFVDKLDKSSKKDCALKIIEEYRVGQLDSFAFNYLNGKKIEDRSFKILMERLNG